VRGLSVAEADVARDLTPGASDFPPGSRSYIYGLGAYGEAGVTKAIEVLGKELDVAMALCGVRNVRDIDRRVIVQI